MKKAKKRIVQLCALIAATLALGQSALPAKALACESCVTETSCQRTYAGVTSCSIGADNLCHQSQTTCQPAEP